MLFFPQLASGTLAQFPITKKVVQPAVTNRTIGGATLQMADPDAARIEWKLRYTGLTDAERNALDGLFHAVEGRLKPFLFLDPTANLLRWSDDLSKNVWHADPMLRVEEGRLVNTAQSAQSAWQTVAVPGALQYAFGALLKSEADASVAMTIRSADGEVSSTCPVGREWTHVFCTGSIPGEAEEISCRIEVPAGAVLRVQGFQLDAQPMPGAYARSTGRSGVYPNTRFRSDRIVFTANGIDDHAVTVELTSPAGG